METLFKFKYEAMGTHWAITIWDDLSDQEKSSIQTEVITKTTDFDQKYSRFKPDSIVSKLSDVTGIVDVPEDLIKMLKIYKAFYAMSNKKLNPLIGATLSDLGYDIDYSLKPKVVISKVLDFDETIKIVNDHQIEINKKPNQKIQLDLGAVGKGYFVDLLADYLYKKNIKRFLVDGSGDIYYEGNGFALKVGLEHPLDTSKVIGTIDMVKGAMCSSSGNRRKWAKYNHIIDPDSRESPDYIIAAWVTTKSCAIADALTTVLFMNTPDTVTLKASFDYCLLNKDLKVKRSTGFNATLF